MQPAKTPAARLWQAIEELELAGNRQVLLAQQFGVSQGQIAEWKAGRGGVDLERVLRYQAEQGIRAGWVLLGEGPPLVRDEGEDLYAKGAEDGFREGLRFAAEQLQGMAGAVGVGHFTLTGHGTATVGEVGEGQATPRPAPDAAALARGAAAMMAAEAKRTAGPTPPQVEVPPSPPALATPARAARPRKRSG